MTRWPLSVWTTSGCHCTAYRRRAGSSKAAIGAPVGGRGADEARGQLRRRRPGATSTPTGWPSRPPSSSADVLKVGLGPAELAPGGVAHGAAQGDGHRLQAVANAEHGHPGGEQRRVGLGRPRRINALGAAGQDDGARAGGRRSRPPGVVWGIISL